MMKQLAVGLIALLAGAELKIRDLVERYRSIVWIVALQTVRRPGRPDPPDRHAPALDSVPGPGSRHAALLRATAVRRDAHGQLADGDPRDADRDPEAAGPLAEDDARRGPPRGRGDHPHLHRRVQPRAGEPRRQGPRRAPGRRPGCCGR